MVGVQAATVAIGLIVLFVFWMFLGIISDASGIAIYGSFPSKPFSPQLGTFTITIRNNAAESASCSALSSIYSDFERDLYLLRRGTM